MGPDDFEAYQEGETLYKDLNFPIQDVIRWDDKPQASGKGLKKHEKNVEWVRIRDKFPPSEGYSLWGENGVPTVHDIIQGDLGNCWFIAAASALAEKPGRIEKLFRNE